MIEHMKLTLACYAVVELSLYYCKWAIKRVERSKKMTMILAKVLVGLTAMMFALCAIAPMMQDWMDKQ